MAEPKPPTSGGDEPSGVHIETMLARHWPEVTAVYQAGIDTGHATFEESPPRWADFDRVRLPAHRLVALDDSGAVLGWAAASPVSTRRVYAGVVEHSLFVAAGAQGRGVGRALLTAFVTSTEEAGIWTVQSGIFHENRASLALHHRVGFREVGVRHRVGLMTYGPMAGQWRDVVLLERRSRAVGG